MQTGASRFPVFAVRSASQSGRRRVGPVCDGVFAVIATVGALAAGCSSTSEPIASLGALGDDCSGEQACESTLVCRLNICVDPNVSRDAAVSADAAPSGTDTETGAQADASSVAATGSSAASSTATGMGPDGGAPSADAGASPTSSATATATSPLPTGSASTEVPVLEPLSCEAKLMAPAPSSPSDSVELDEFGGALDISGDTLVVSAKDDELGSDVGAVFVYVRGADTWELQAKLLPQLEDGTFVTTPSSRFGSALSLDGNTLAVGAPYADAQGSGSGAVYTYVRSGTTWTPEGPLLAQLPEGDEDGSPSDAFGSALSLSGDTLAISAPGDENPGFNNGAAYVYVRDSEGWLPQAKLLPQLANGDPDLYAGDRFGFPLSLDGDSLALGAHNADVSALDSGAVYVFSRAGDVWSPTATVTAQLPNGTSDAAESDAFGSTLSMSGGTLVVGAPAKAERSGAVYVYSQDGVGYSLQAKLAPQVSNAEPESMPGMKYGVAVHVLDQTVLVGANGNDARGEELGMAYRYQRQGNVWFFGGKIVAELPDGTPDAVRGDSFGQALAGSTDFAVIAAPRARGARDVAGVVYVYAY